MIGDLLKIVAVVGTLVYAILFIGYQSYFSILGIHPEDVGISHSFILVRSIGLILLAVALAVVIAIIIYITNFINFAAEGDWRVFVLALASVICIGLLVSQLLSFVLSALHIGVSWKTQAAAFAGIVMMMYLIDHRDQIDPQKKFRYVALVLAILAAIVLPAVAINNRAKELGAATAHGNPVKPLTVLGLPVLDVSSDMAAVTWICPMAQRPPIFNGSVENAIHGMIVGDTSTNVFVLYPGPDNNTDQSKDKALQARNIISFPESCVIVSRSLAD